MTRSLHLRLCLRPGARCRQADALLGQLYPMLSPHLTFFRPIRKVAARKRVGAHTVSATTSHALPSIGSLRDKLRLHQGARLQKTNPILLQRRSDALLRQIWQLAPQERKPGVHVG